MDAADVLYGVSMGGDGVTKVVSRRLPREVAEDEDAGDEGDVAGRSRRRPSRRRSPAADGTIYASRIVRRRGGAGSNLGGGR